MTTAGAFGGVLLYMGINHSTTFAAEVLLVRVEALYIIGRWLHTLDQVSEVHLDGERQLQILG